MTNQKIYLLLSHDPEEVIGAFSSEEAADTVNRELFGYEGFILPCTLDSLLEKVKQGLKFFYMTAQLDEETITGYEDNPTFPFMFDTPIGCPKVLVMGFWAKDRDDAIKIAKEKRAKYLEELKDSSMGIRYDSCMGYRMEEA